MNALCKYKSIIAAAFALLWCIPALYSCADRTVTGGGADVGNPAASIKGRAAYKNSNAAAVGAFVYLRDINYVRAIEDSARPVLVNAQCNDSGAFSIDSVVAGVYLLEIRSGDGFAAVARCAIADSSTKLDLGLLPINPVGTLRGVVLARQRENTSWFAQIFGTDRIAAVNQRTGAFFFPNVPEGVFSIQLKPTNGSVVSVTIDSVKIISGAETVLSAYPQWRYSRVLTLNTSANSADVKGDVVGFPVLVRLTFGQL